MGRWYKCTRPNGRDFKTDTIDYAAALDSGEPIEIDAEPASGNVCGKGLHVSPTPKLTIQFASKEARPWRWFEVEVKKQDIVEQDAKKARVRRLRVLKELSLADIFGEDLSQRVEEAKAETALWKSIPWLKPPTPVSDAQLSKLFALWRDALKPWLNGKKLPAKMRVARSAAAAAAAAADGAAAADAAAAAAAAAADAADAAADAAAADAADAAAAADADAAAADAAAADAAAAAAAAAADAAAAAAAAAALRRFYSWRWYMRPYYVLRGATRWKLAGMEGANPFEPLAEMYKLGVLPIGYSGGEFVIYVPKTAKGKS